MDQTLHEQFAEIEWTHWWFNARRRILSDVLACRWRVADGEPRAILDAGCGAGAMLGVLQKHGRVSGMDISEDSVAHCRTVFPDVDLWTGGVPAGLPSDTQFDAVCAFDVIEHIDDDVMALKALAEVVRPGGDLVVTVPAYQWLWGPHDDLNEHKRRYTRRRLRRALLDAGVEVDRISYFNTVLLPPIAIARLFRRWILRRTEPASDFVVPGPTTNRLLTSLMSVERHWLRHAPLPAGVSLLAIARVPLA
jgi:SAM-dependent methyltransferase